MPINLTTDLIINSEAKPLNSAIREALQTVAKGMLVALGMADLNPDLITSKKNMQGAFSKFTQMSLLISTETLDKKWLENVYTSYYLGATNFNRAAFEEIFRCGQNPILVWTKVFAQYSLPGLGFTLLKLHASKVITLPATFNWPTQRNSYYNALSLELCKGNELLEFIRSLDIPKNRTKKKEGDRDSNKPHESFGRVGHDQFRAEWLGTRGTKVLLALGWNHPEDMSLDDCRMLNECIKSTRVLRALVGTIKTLLDVLKAKFGNRAPIDGGTWMLQNRETRVEINRNTNTAAVWQLNATENIAQQLGSAEKILEALIKTKPSIGNFETIEKSPQLREYNFNDKYNFKNWFLLHQVFFKQKKYETSAKKKNILGVLGLYLFYYLPAWFEENSSDEIKYPDDPEKLIPAIFISRWIESDKNLPVTLVDFISSRSAASGVKNSSQYQVLNQISVFFDFLVENAGLLTGCENFKNHLSPYDYPRNPRTIGTNKRAIPRRLFSPYLQYVAAIKSYYDLVLVRLLDGSLDYIKYEQLRADFSTVDTFSNRASEIGYIPVVFYNNKCIPIRYISYQPGLVWYKLNDGRHAKIICPHSINQILCALMTGLRHNHIQWLDVRTFDRLVQDDDSAFTELYVNTDKVKRTGWAPIVNIEVIHLLRTQREWRKLVSGEHFNKLHNYNNNEQSIYEPILPLFSHGIDGAPHQDSMYYWAWYELLAGFQGFASNLFELDDQPKINLVQLLPPGVPYNDYTLKVTLQQWSSTANLRLRDNPKVELVPKSDITPHSSRVSVVTHTLTYLPVEIIGQFITGQTAATVTHYFNPDPEDAERNLVHQGLHLRDSALARGAVETIISDEKASHHIQVDMNSVLARSLKKDIENTIANHGCISLVIGDKDQSGVDILRERGIISLAFNTTEICPYENNCPESIIKMLRGFRRCSLCPAAVRSIDHLPAITAKKKQALEIMLIIDNKLSTPNLGKKYSDTDLDLLEDERQRHAEDIAGWEANEQILEVQRGRIASGVDTRRWLVEKPEIIQADLQKTQTPNSGSIYLLTRLAECVSYPGFQSEYIKTMIDNTRRRILARAGDLNAALSNRIPVDPASEFAGLIRSLVQANGLSSADIARLLDTDGHLELMEKPLIFGIEYDGDIS